MSDTNFSILLLLATMLATGASATDMEAAGAVAKYDRELCATAQRMLINDPRREVKIVVNRAPPGGGFGTLQMDIPEGGDHVVVAMLTEQVEVDGETLDAAVWCKLVNQDRVNDVLGAGLAPPPRSCRHVNEATYRLSLAMLSIEQRRRFESEGRPLRFVDDFNAEAGAAWLPAIVNDHIEAVAASGETPAHLRVQAPTVQVPWDDRNRDWYKGTHHCKLITLAAMRRWMTSAAFAGATELFPRSLPECTAPSQMSSQIGSCVQFFGPADATFCADYSGAGWTEATAREECAQRHLTKTAWLEKDRAYIGAGGQFSTQSCAEREASAEVLREPFALADSGHYGTCVFRCQQNDETLWHSLTDVPAGNQGRGGVQRACDLFIPPD